MYEDVTVDVALNRNLQEKRVRVRVKAKAVIYVIVNRKPQEKVWETQVATLVVMRMILGSMHSQKIDVMSMILGSMYP